MAVKTICDMLDLAGFTAPINPEENPLGAANEALRERLEQADLVAWGLTNAVRWMVSPDGTAPLMIAVYDGKWLVCRGEEKTSADYFREFQGHASEPITLSPAAREILRAAKDQQSKGAPT